MNLYRQWKCSRQRKGCDGRGREDNVTKVFEMTAPHNHCDREDVIQEDDFYKALEKYAKSGVGCFSKHYERLKKKLVHVLTFL